uniref:Immunoglobulin V-set domain-containing protein n=1 Tax=Anabas testudineus TaxID=64144 RepID=A0A3Q1IVU0_ANATE
LLVGFLFYYVSPVSAGSRAVTPVFVQKGNDVLLDVIKADVPEDFILFWNFNGSDVLVRYSPGGKRTVSDLYSGRVEFSVKSYSVELKNLQNTDSGVYTAKVIASQEKKVAEYIVTVQVSPVSLTVDSVSSSSDSCNITVTCRTQDSNISSTFRCVNQICEDKREKSKTTTSGTFLHVNLVNDSIICNHSNQVSWTTNTGPSKIQDFCQHDGKNERQDNQLMYSLDSITAGIAVGVLVPCLLVLVLSIYCCKFQCTENGL